MRAVELDVMVLHPLFLTENRIEVFRVKIAVVDLVPFRPQGLDDLAMQSRSEATVTGLAYKPGSSVTYPPLPAARQPRSGVSS